MRDYFVIRIKKSLVGCLAISLGTLLAILVVLEVVLRTFWPQEYMIPTYMYSNQYVNWLFPNTTMVEEKPGRWKFTYVINSYGYRGKLVKPSNNYLKPNIVVLGDSYAFGEGVDEGAQYSAVLDRELNGQYDVINLGVPGWGLTQEIRRYFEFGILFNPKVVILQFHANDPVDNLSYPVTAVVDGRFVFRDDNQLELKRLNTLLADSFVQRLQVYNFVKYRLWRLYFSTQRTKLVAKKNAPNRDVAIPFEEINYVELLDLFVKSLSENKTHVLFVPVGQSLQRVPYIADSVKNIATKNAFFNVIETGEWFKGVEEYSSPEGHSWGEKAHRIIGRNLAKFIVDLAG
jgi:hypothetical protein